MTKNNYSERQFFSVGKCLITFGFSNARLPWADPKADPDGRIARATIPSFVWFFELRSQLLENGWSSITSCKQTFNSRKRLPLILFDNKDLEFWPRTNWNGQFSRLWSVARDVKRPGRPPGHVSGGRGWLTRLEADQERSLLQCKPFVLGE